MENKINYKHKKNGIGFAIFLILIGVVFLCVNTGVIPAAFKPIVISWQMLVIILGFWFIIKRHYIGGVFTVLIGLFFIYPKLGIAFPDYFSVIQIDIKTYWPVILIVVGLIIFLAILFPPAKKRHGSYWMKGHAHACRQMSDADDRCIQTDNNNSDYFEKSMMCGSSKQIILSPEFKGGKADLMFGELIIDLRKAKLAEGIHQLDLNIMFGSAILQIPPNWTIELKSNVFLGSFDDKRYDIDNTAGSSDAKLVITGNCVFGAGEIQN